MLFSDAASLDEKMLAVSFFLAAVADLQRGKHSKVKNCPSQKGESQTCVVGARTQMVEIQVLKVSLNIVSYS